MIYVKEYDCSENSQGIEFIGLTTFDDKAEAFAYAKEQKKKANKKAGIKIPA